jgi:hypothetical protein
VIIYGFCIEMCGIAMLCQSHGNKQQCQRIKIGFYKGLYTIVWYCNEMTISIEESRKKEEEILFDTRIPHNMEYVMISLLRMLVRKGVFSPGEAKWTLSTGESYLH